MTKSLDEKLDAFIQRQRVKIVRDTGETQWRTVRSLWEMLERSAMQSGGSGRSSASSNRLPISATAVDLVILIAGAAAEGADDLADVNRHNVPDNLRAIVSKLVALPEKDDVRIWWTDAIETWTRQAKTILHMDPSLPRWIRGQACPLCEATHAQGSDGVEQTTVPALGLVWVGPEDEEEAARPDAKWTMRAVTCGACAHTWWRGSDFEELFEQMMTLNRTRETLAG